VSVAQFRRRVGLDASKVLAGFGVHRRQRAAVFTEEDDPARGGPYAAPTVRASDVAGFERNGPWIPTGRLGVDAAGFAGLYVEPTGDGTDGNRGPVGRAENVGADLGSIARGFLAGNENGPAVFADAGGPSEAVDELFGEQEFAVRAVKNVKEAIAVGLDQEFAFASAEGEVDDQGRLAAIPIVEVVWGELVVPFELSRARVEGYDARGVEVVALPCLASAEPCHVSESGSPVAAL